MINDSNWLYRNKGLALVQKIPTPITPVQLNKRGQISLAFFEEKSTVDYIGAVQGIPVCFDAKECKKTTFPLANVHPHQMKFMKEMEDQGGIAFFLINFNSIREDLYYFMPYKMMEKFWKRMEEGGRKSFRYDELDKKWILPAGGRVIVPYLEGIKMYLEQEKAEQKNAAKEKGEIPA